MTNRNDNKHIREYNLRILENDLMKKTQKSSSSVDFNHTLTFCKLREERESKILKSYILRK